MRKQFAEYLYQIMSEDDRLYLISADLGYKLWDRIRDIFPDRFLNCGASEMAGMNICVGLALEGKIPIFYSISSFAIYRPFETIHNYLNGEQVPVKICMGGRDFDYKIDGPSHHSPDMKKILDTLPNLVQFWPNETKDLYPTFTEFIYNKKPSVISLRKG